MSIKEVCNRFVTIFVEKMTSQVLADITYSVIFSTKKEAPEYKPERNFRSSKCYLQSS